MSNRRLRADELLAVVNQQQREEEERLRSLQQKNQKNKKTTVKQFIPTSSGDEKISDFKSVLKNKVNIEEKEDKPREKQDKPEWANKKINVNVDKLDKEMKEKQHAQTNGKAPEWAGKVRSKGLIGLETKKPKPENKTVPAWKTKLKKIESQSSGKFGNESSGPAWSRKLNYVKRKAIENADANNNEEPDSPTHEDSPPSPESSPPSQEPTPKVEPGPEPEPEPVRSSRRSRRIEEEEEDETFRSRRSRRTHDENTDESLKEDRYTRHAWRSHEVEAEPEEENDIAARRRARRSRRRAEED